MKNLFKVAFVLLMFSVFTVVSCSPETNINEEVQATEKDKVCPPGNPNC